jgi:hypothetical protein
LEEQNMSEMVERVAKAIWDQERKQPDCGHRPDWEVLNVTAADAYRAKARAAIETMWEPTQVMMKAAELSLDENTIGRPKGIVDTWQAMVDAALK